MGKRGMRGEIGVIDDYARVSPDIIQEILDEVVANINRNAANLVFLDHTPTKEEIIDAMQKILDGDNK